jgi:hypothetical protein
MPLNHLDAGAAGMICEYNGYSFSKTAYTQAFSVRPNLDPAGRTVMSATYRITVCEYIADADTTDPHVKDAIARLSRNAGKLRYKGRGFGDLDINVGAGVENKRDVSWGPHTLSISCEAVGAARAVMLTWEVEFTIVNCPDGLTEPGTVLAFTFTVGYDIDAEGYTTRHYEATLTIAQTKKSVDDTSLKTTADIKREQTVPALLPGFRRQSQSFRLSPDKCTLTTAVVDVQMPPYLPPKGAVDAKVEQTWQSQGLAKWVSTITATYDVARKGGTPAQMVEHFRDVVFRRRFEASKMVVGAGLDLGARLPEGILRGGPAAIIPLQASISEPNILGRTQVKISLTFLACGIGFDEILRSGGLWKEIPGWNSEKNWKAWTASIPTAFSPRGHAELIFTPREDALLDACVPGAGTKVPVASPGGTNRDQPSRASDLIRLGATGALERAFPPPKAPNSWIEYRAFVTIFADVGRVIGSTLPSNPLTLPRSGQGSPSIMLDGPSPAAPAGDHPFPPLRGLLGAQSSAGGETYAHQRTRPTLYVHFRGQALRAGWDIPMPELVAVNGTRPVLVGQPQFTRGIVGNAMVPIVRADWSMTYAFTDDGGISTKAIPMPANPYFA